MLLARFWRARTSAVSALSSAVESLFFFYASESHDGKVTALIQMHFQIGLRWVPRATKVSSLGFHRVTRYIQTHGGPSWTKVLQQSPFVHVSEEVRDAVENTRPVVALETTIYTHGALSMRCAFVLDLKLLEGSPTQKILL